MQSSSSVTILDHHPHVSDLQISNSGLGNEAKFYPMAHGGL
jgi:hypothetical protein